MKKLVQFVIFLSFLICNIDLGYAIPSKDVINQSFMLHRASEQLNHKEVADYLAAGADVNSVNSEGQTPLRLAISATASNDDNAHSGLEIVRSFLKQPETIVDYNVYVHAKREHERSVGKWERSILKPEHLKWQVDDLKEIVALLGEKKP